LRIAEGKGAHKGSAKKSEAQNEQRFPLAKAALLLAMEPIAKAIRCIHGRFHR